MDAHTKQIWDGLIGFANAATVENAAKELQRTVASYLPWVLQTEWELMFAPFLDDAVWAGWVEAGRQYQPSLQVLLRWLCSAPKSEERDSLRPQAFGFLREHAGHIGGVYLTEVEYVDEPRPDAEGNFDEEKVKQHEESRRYWNPRTRMPREDSPLGICTITRRYRDLADPICDFLCAEYQKFRNGDYKQSVPIFICPRCQKFVMPKRIGAKKFCDGCSPKARGEEHRKKALPDEGRDYQYLYRLVENLEQENATIVKIRLKNPKVRRRVDEIEKRQQTSAKCQKLLAQLKQWRAMRVAGGFRQHVERD